VPQKISRRKMCRRIVPKKCAAGIVPKIVLEQECAEEERADRIMPQKHLC